MGCARKCLIFTGILAIFMGYKLNNLIKSPPPPKLEDTWWGKDVPGKQDTSIRPFKVAVSDQILSDLKYRLDHARPFTPPLEGIQQQYGMNTNLLKKILDFWKTKYDWKSRENLFNQFPQFKTNIQGLDIHYIHVKPKPTNLKVLPLLIIHGWPGSVREFFDTIPILTTPQKDKDFVFEVIVASIPGYGFSDGAVRPGLGAAQAAVVFKNLMQRLGFEKYYIQGGDWGSFITQAMAVMYPDVVLGRHSNMCVVYTPLSFFKLFLGVVYPTWFTREEHVERVYPLGEKLFEVMLRETGYLHLQATKPDTIGVALTDSPVGLAAYILEKFVTGTNFTHQLREDGGLVEEDYADLLDNVMLYWITNSMTTAMRLYSETFNKKHRSLELDRIPVLVPSACARFENDFYSSDGMLNEVYPNLLHLSDYKGGHFAAFQLPEVFSKDVFRAVEKFENFHSQQKTKV